MQGNLSEELFSAYIALTMLSHMMLTLKKVLSHSHFQCEIRVQGRELIFPSPAATKW